MGSRLAAGLNPLASPCSRNRSPLILTPRQMVITSTRRTTATLLLMVTTIIIVTAIPIAAVAVIVVAIHPPVLAPQCPIPVRLLLTTITTTIPPLRVILPTPKTNMKTIPLQQTQIRPLISPTASTRRVVRLPNAAARTLLPRRLRR